MIGHSMGITIGGVLVACREAVGMVLQKISKF